MAFKSIHVVSFLFLLGLAACGQEWEEKLVNDRFAYGMERTAGSGVVYVRAKLLPEKELNLTPVERPREPEVVPEPEVMNAPEAVIEPDALQDLEPVFNDGLIK